MNFSKVLLVFVLVASAGCAGDHDADEYLNVETERSILAAGLKSYMSFKEVSDILELKPGQFVVLDDSKTDRSPRVPPFNIYTVMIPAVDFNGHNGKVILSFFNDRLMETRFYPPELNVFVRDMGWTIDAITAPKHITVAPFTNVWIDRDHDDLQYIGWIDVRLRKQFDAWIKTYS